MNIPINILCQSPISENMSATTAIHNTVELAIAAEKLGYHRFWVAEHHSDRSLASGSPEILVAHIAARTNTMKVGSGGVLLPFYRPFKVAEQFKTLAALYPGRIDLGLGRAGGSEGQAPKALGLQPRDPYQSLDELFDWLLDRPVLENTFASPPGERPTPWILGTSPNSARYAGERGLPYAFGGFLDPRQMMPALQTYHQSFTPGRWATKPLVNLAWYVQAADTSELAWKATTSSERWMVQCLLRGNCTPFPDPATLGAEDFNAMEKMVVQMRRQLSIIGTAEEVAEGLKNLQQQTAADELTLVTIPFAFQERLRSYELISQALNLARSS